MRIDEKISSHNIDKKGRKADPGKVKGVGSTPFATQLAKSGDQLADRAAELEELKKEIDMAGDSLERDPSPSNFKAFREALSGFIRTVSSEAYKVVLLHGSPRAPAYHEIISIIDNHADALYRLIMSEQKDRIKIAAKIQEIKGIVISFHL